jgi:NAD-dependent SIR2 family protein deacetylase
MTDNPGVQAAADLIRLADSILITAGAGMGVDSGLPDFRGDHGFWQAYPALAQTRMRFVEIANPAAFRSDPASAWGFYGHRLQLYRDTVPHRGFAILRELAGRTEHGSFVYTSNVDGQFQKAGFSPARIEECHGSIHVLQCLDNCSGSIWPADCLVPLVDAVHCRMTSALPRCPHCGQLARPNILMFNDSSWVADRSELQEIGLYQWLAKVRRPVVIELGAGTHIPSVRRRGEALGVPLIRINPRESGVDGASDVGLAMGALEGLERILLALQGHPAQD